MSGWLRRKGPDLPELGGGEQVALPPYGSRAEVSPNAQEQAAKQPRHLEDKRQC